MSLKSVLNKIRLTCLPRSLWWRSMTIMVVPVVLIEIVISVVFFDTHWQNVSRRLALGITDDVSAVIEMKKDLKNSPETFETFLETLNRSTGLDFAVLPPAPYKHIPLTKQTVWRTSELRTALKDMKIPFTISDVEEIHGIRLMFHLKDFTLQLTIPYKRFFSSTVYVFALWTLATTLLVMIVAALFMKNQIRPIVRLAKAAESFGMGRNVEKFKPEGALEVRQAASSFIQMRDRIRRYIDERTRMLAGISHDLRTPLTRMRLQLAMMGDDESIRELLNDVEEMEQMVNGYLSFMKGLETGEVVETNVSVLIAGLISAYGKAGTSLRLAAEPNVMLNIRVNDFKRCLGNILSNALRFGTQIDISLTQKDRFVEIVIEDNGPGIPKERREDVFKAFFRLDESRNSETGGVGLGLSIARDIVLAHGGTISLDDSQLGGLKAVLRFPR